MLDDIKDTLKSYFWRIKSLCTQCCYRRHLTLPENLTYTTSGLLILMHGAISVPKATSNDYWFYCQFEIGFRRLHSVNSFSVKPKSKI